jgi:hypothetical protein
MSTAVKGNQTKAGRRSENPKGLIHVGAQAMLEKERDAGTGVLVVEVDLVVSQLGHLRSGCVHSIGG